MKYYLAITKNRANIYDCHGLFRNIEDVTACFPNALKIIEVDMPDNNPIPVEKEKVVK